MDKKPHPAKYSNELLPVLAKYCYGDIIDVMGGTEGVKPGTRSSRETKWHTTEEFDSLPLPFKEHNERKYDEK